MTRLIFSMLGMALTAGILSCHEVKDRRQDLIAGLRGVEEKIKANDRDEVARLFPFPIPDSMLSIFIEDSSFTRERREGHGLSREMYNRYYDSISRSWQMDEFRQVFDNLDLQRLKREDRIKKEVIVKGEPCYKYYSIEVGVDSIISINYGTNSNPKYERRKGDAGEEFCEHAIIWQFRLEDGKLRLIRQTEAG